MLVVSSCFCKLLLVYKVWELLLLLELGSYLSKILSISLSDVEPVTLSKNDIPFVEPVSEPVPEPERKRGRPKKLIVDEVVQPKRRVGRPKKVQLNHHHCSA